MRQRQSSVTTETHWPVRSTGAAERAVGRRTSLPSLAALPALRGQGNRHDRQRRSDQHQRPQKWIWGRVSSHGFAFKLL